MMQACRSPGVAKRERPDLYAPPAERARERASARHGLAALASNGRRLTVP